MSQAHTDAGAYEFAQPPSAVPPTRAPYRDPFAQAQIDAPSNIMWDRRVVRGNTYSAQVLTPSQQAEMEMEQERQKAATMRGDMASSYKEMSRPRTPSPVDGRRNADVQTDSYLEELSDKVPEADGTTQTEAFMDRPPTPIFVPAKTGLDAETQILPGDLFDFEMEVEPILEVLVGKTIEQSLMEVHEDMELENIRARQREFEQIRNVELAEVQRLEAEVRRKYAEKKRRMEQERERVAREAQVREKVAAAAFARSHLSSMMNQVFGQLVEDGHFYDPLTREVEETFLPGIYNRVAVSLDKQAFAHQLTDALIASTVELGYKVHATEVARVKAEEERRRAEEEAARKAAAEEAARKKAEEEEAARKAAEAEAAEEEGDDD